MTLTNEERKLLAAEQKAAQAAEFAIIKAHIAAADGFHDIEYLLALRAINGAMAHGTTIENEIEDWAQYHGAGECESCEKYGPVRDHRDMSVCASCASGEWNYS